MMKTERNQKVFSAYEVQNGQLQYYIEATDGINKAYYGTENQPYIIKIIPIVSTTTTTETTTTNQTTTTTQPNPSAYILGDVDNNSVIDAVDASKVLAYYARISTKQEGGFSDRQKQAGDVNKDGIIDAVDASKILAYYAYLSTTKDDVISLEAYIKRASK